MKHYDAGGRLDCDHPECAHDLCAEGYCICDACAYDWRTVTREPWNTVTCINYLITKPLSPLIWAIMFFAVIWWLSLGFGGIGVEDLRLSKDQVRPFLIDYPKSLLGVLGYCVTALLSCLFL